MRLAIIPILCSILVAAAIVKRDCSHDNCLRAVIASAFPNRDGAADCSSFFRTTVTPAATTVTATATVIMSVTTTTFTHAPYRRALEHEIEVRQTTVVPSSIPAYASACSGSVRYSSACSCIGVTGITTTALAPSKKVTISSTTTTTVTATDAFAAPSLLTSEYLNADCTDFDYNDTLINGVCIFIPDLSIGFDVFISGSCSASDCVVAFYTTIDCTGSATIQGVSTPQCIDATAYLTYKLICSGNGCS